MDRPIDVIGRNDPWDPLMSVSEPWMHWTRSNLGEAMPGVQTPLSWSVWSRAMEHAPREAAYRVGALTRAEAAVPERVDERFIRIFYGRPAMQVAFAALLGDRLPGTTGEATVQSVFGRVPDNVEFSPTRRRYPIVAGRLPITFLTVDRQIHRVAAGHDAWWRDRVARAQSLELAAARAQLRDAVNMLDEALMWQTIDFVAVQQPLYEMLSRLVARAGRGDLSALAGASGGAELGVVTAIWDAAHGSGSIADVVAAHGFHGPSEGELISRVWREDDAPLRRMVDGYAKRDLAGDPGLRDRQRRAERARIEQEVLDGLPGWLVPPARVLLRLARQRLPQRGVAKRSYVQAFDVARASARRIGHLLRDEHALADPDDVFYLTLDEVLTGPPPDAQDLIDRRRVRRVAYQGLVMPGEWSGNAQPETLDAAGPADGEPVSGVGVSAGVAEGLVRVVNDPDFAEVQPGEILVAPFTDPSWSSIMFLSAALVVDIGGPLSHAAVVARELEIPCVVNTRTGTKALRTGDRVRVDGSRGTIEILVRTLVD